VGHHLAFGGFGDAEIAILEKPAQATVFEVGVARLDVRERGRRRRLNGGVFHRMDPSMTERSAHDRTLGLPARASSMRSLTRPYIAVQYIQYKILY